MAEAKTAKPTKPLTLKHGASYKAHCTNPGCGKVIGTRKMDRFSDRFCSGECAVAKLKNGEHA